ncbi:SafA/ExsA family spore coat assembly protein [Bacillus aquiflavi]|uniref:SafA/ExsA family spore coat assembly protein n=1 Tax=Bacillus aquiflavi TaxID=2672567 RepID=UPI001CA8F0DA|nr:SafA/ExsA family spore coat assembly protein [Bacillus aquiflavi]UAC47400.1 SafA/ExsA family spore coat assembly protein [Bacillus aquiflavi]
MKIHIVQKGDTLWKIAKKYGVNFEELKKVNSHLSNPDLIMPGMKIKVPTMGGTVKKKMHDGKMKEAPIVKEKKKKQPVMPKEVPKKVKPKKEKPIVPTVPIMPQPTMPEIDINNYYMVNMAKMSMQQQQPQVQPYIPPKPVYILPGIEKEESPESPEKKYAYIPPQPQGGLCQPMYYHPSCCTPISPVMPGYGYHYPVQQPMTCCHPQPMPYPQVQGTAMMPGYHGMMHGSESSSYMHHHMHMKDESSSSSFMPHMGDMNYHMMGQYGPMNAPVENVPVPPQYMPQAPAMQIPAGGGYGPSPAMAPMGYGPQAGYMPQPGYMPYGAGPQPYMQPYDTMGAGAFGMPRSEEESSEYDR